MVLKNAARLNGLTGIAVTKLDVLGGLDELKICTAYRYRGETLEEFPANLKVLAECEPIYETLPGWSEDISSVRQKAGLPDTTVNYLNRIEELTATPIDIVSVGPGREQTIVLNNPFGG